VKPGFEIRDSGFAKASELSAIPPEQATRFILATTRF